MTQKDIRRIENVQKYFLSFAGYVLKISYSFHNYTLADFDSYFFWFLPVAARD